MSRILVIDDDDGVRQLIRLILESEGYTVAEAEAADRGLDLVQQGKPDLVLLDLAMPGMDGWKFLDELRTRGLREHTRVLIVSALSDQDTVERGRQEGALGHLSKPFSMEDLLEAVKAALAVAPEDLAAKRERLGDLAKTLKVLDDLLS